MITFIPIGYVRNDSGEYVHQEDLRQMRSVIEIEPRYADGLMDIEINELITVIYYFHLNRGEYRLRLHPRGDESRPITGVFNTRSQFRPNPIGVTVVRLMSRERNKLLVEWLDALDGTPVLDIKPHVLTFDEGKVIDDPRKDRTLKTTEQP